MKLKLKPSQRLKRRYLLLETSLNKKQILESILKFSGALGLSQVSPIFLESKKGTVLAVERTSVEMVRAAFELNKSPIKIVKVSGTIRNL